MTEYTHADMYYEPGLVMLSIMIAILAAYLALDLVRRSQPGNSSSKIWLLAGAGALGMGIWTMHFVAMQAMLTLFDIRYDVPTTLVSLIIALLACGAGLSLVSLHKGARYRIWGGLIIGLGVAGMHYTGMAAMRFQGVLHYDFLWVALSIVVAVSAATLALWMPTLLARLTPGVSLLADMTAAVLMGVAIAGMHYTGMLGTHFVLNRISADESGLALDGPVMVIAVATAGSLLMILLLISSNIQRRWTGQLENEKELHRLSEARLKMLIDGVADSIINFDAGGLIRLFNPAAEQLFGYTCAEVIGRNVSQLIPELGRARQDDSIAEYLRRGKSKVVGQGPRDVEGVNKLGETIALEIVLNEIGGPGDRHFVAVIRDVTERKKAHAQLFYQANFDLLTGLLNRQLFLNRMGHALTHAKRNNALVGLLFMDLDGFKQVNDTLGHDAGDGLLMRVADRLKQNTRESDSVARFGGDEFVVLLEMLEKPHHAGVMATKLLHVLAAPYAISGREVLISASIGIAIYPQHGEGIEALLQGADSAMYAAKQAGKNQFRIVDIGTPKDAS